MSRWYALALLNSVPLDYYLNHISTVYGGHTYSYSDQFIKQLPILLSESGHQRAITQRLEELARSVSRTKGEMRGLQVKVQGFPRAFADSLALGTELYPLRRIASAIPRARTVATAGFTVEAGLDGLWRVRWGRSSLGLPSESHARVVELWLGLRRGLVSTEEVLALHVPSNSEACDALLIALRDAEQQVERLKDGIREAEAEINDLVADLYGLDREARNVMGEFLGKF